MSLSSGALLANRPFRGGPFAPVYNVKSMFSAFGDGVHDDTAAWQDALDAGAGSTVFAPYTPSGYLCGALTIHPGTVLVFDAGAKLVAPSSLATPWIQGETGVVHQGTQVLGGTFDATAVTSTLCTAVLYFGVVSCPDLLIWKPRLISAPVHGIFVSESTYTKERKLIESPDVNKFGVAAVGYGVYADYIGGTTIAKGFVYSQNGYDAYELGHSGPQELGINSVMTVRDCVASGGPIQFPFSYGARILHNVVDGAGIINDTNTADDVLIVDNTVLGCTPAAGYAGIRVAGIRSIIKSNHVEVTTGDGIAGTGLTDAVVTGNYIKSTSATPAGSAINDGTGGGYSIIANNQLDGTNGGGFTDALTLTGAQHDVRGNKVLNGGCFDGINNSGTDSAFEDNDLSVYNSALAASGGGTNHFRGNRNINPVGASVPGTAFSLPASGTAWTNNTGVDGTLFVTAAGSVTDVVLQGVTVGSSLAVGQSFFVPAGGTITFTYSAAPTLVFVGN